MRDSDSGVGVKSRKPSSFLVTLESESESALFFTTEVEVNSFLSPPVLMHDGLLCIALHLSVVAKIQTRQKVTGQ